MKVKKDFPKIKKKSKLETTTNSSIKKIKKSKVKKVQNNTAIADAVKKEFSESEKETGSKIPQRQQTWNAHLKVFLASEKLNKKQKQIMEFCTTKQVTPPRRKGKFLNFIRHCYDHQKDVTDEQCNELFDSILSKYDDFKSGKYRAPDVSPSESSAAKLSKNKKKKLNRLANKDSKNSSPNKSEKKKEKFEKVKSKKQKQQKSSSESGEDEDDDNNDDVEMDEDDVSD